MSLASINPATGELIQNYSEFDLNIVYSSIEKTQIDFLKWRKSTFAKRRELFFNLAHILEKQKEEYAHLITIEMGKPIKQSLAEVQKCAWVCKYYAEEGEKLLTKHTVATEASESFVSYQPLGIILGIMPWNFPFWQAIRAATPAIMAGNAFILKHSSNVSECALAIEKLFKQAQAPENLFTNIRVSGSHMETIIAHPLIKGVTLTGSTQAGIKVAAQAGTHLKKTVLELGGSDPYIVLRDANVQQAAKACAVSRMINNGQSCIAAKRFIIEAPIYEQFLDAFLEEMKKYKMGDPLKEETLLGPMAKHVLRDELHLQVSKSVEQGAKLELGGELPLESKGAYYPATVLSNVRPGMIAYQEELFGPVASIIKVENEEDAIQTANDSSFGLGAAIFTQNLEKGKALATEAIESGTCFVNDFVKSDPRLPFGGIKHSGYGRELGTYAIYEFVNIKTICVA